MKFSLRRQLPVPWLPAREARGRLVQQATLSVAVGFSLPSRSAEAPTRLETRAKESNMYTSRWVG